MRDIASLTKSRDKYCRLYERGVITASECAHLFLQLLAEASNDDGCLRLCAELPEFYRVAVLELLDDLVLTNYYRRSFVIGDIRTERQVHDDALNQQELLQRLAPRIEELLRSKRSQSRTVIDDEECEQGN